MHVPGAIIEQAVIPISIRLHLLTIDDARWSASLTGGSWGALAVWVVLLLALQVATWPIVRRVFHRFPDRGWGFGRLVSLLVAAYPVWLLASIEAIAFRAVWCMVALAVVAAIAWIVGWRPGRGRRMSNAAGGNGSAWTLILLSEGVFWTFFGWFLAYRFLNPDSWHPRWGGEKPMELAHINAILRSDHFPPLDPWYADGVLNYYYYGMYLVAFLMKLTGIPSEIAFNLAQPTVIAMFAAGSFSVAAALAGMITRSKGLTVAGGLLGALLVNLAGNLVVIARLFSGLDGSMGSFSDYLYWVWDPRQIVPQTINEFPYFTALYADLHAHVVAFPITVLAIGLCLALASDHRSLVLALSRRLNSGAWLDLLLRLGLLGLALGTLYMTNAWDVPVYGALAVTSLLLATRGIRSLLNRAATAAAGVVVTGSLAWAMALPFTREYVSRYGEIERVRDTSPLVSIEAHFGVFLLVIAFGLSLLGAQRWRSAPLWAHPGPFAILLAGVLVVRWVVSDGETATIERVDQVTAGLVVLWLVVAIGMALPQRLDFRLPSGIAWLPLIATWTAVVWSLATDRVAFALLAGIGAAAAVIWLMVAPIAHRFVLSLIAEAMFVAAGVEIVYLVDDLSGEAFYRMNTVFKFYNATWVMAAVASSALIVMMIRQVSLPPRREVGMSQQRDYYGGDAFQTPLPLLQQASEHYVEPDEAVERVDPWSQAPGPEEAHSTADRTRALSSAWAMVGLTVAIVAIVASLAYPVVATGIRLDQRFPQSGRSWTLNSLDWMDYGEVARPGVVLTYDEDRDAIEWFNSEVSGSPVIAEVSLGAYFCAGSRISVHTGLPVVVGWLWHETQQRGRVDLVQRETDLRLLYTTEDVDEKLRVIDKYGVEYIVVGDLERVYPQRDCTPTDNAAGIAAFEPLVGARMEVAFESGETVVYRVIRD